MLTESHYDHVVGELYQAAAGERGWPEVLQRLTEVLGGSYIQLVAVEQSTGRMVLSLHSSGSHIDGVLDYMRYYHRIDPHMAHVVTLPPGQLFNSADLISVTEARLHPFYRDFWSIYGVRYVSAGKISESSELAVCMGLLRSDQQGPSPPEVDTVLRRLLVHFDKAFAIYSRYTRLSAQIDSGRLVIDQALRPILLLDLDRRLVHANTAAQRLLAQGELIAERQGQLACRDRRGEGLLAQALAALGLGEGGGPSERQAFVLRDVQGRPVPACLWALRPARTMHAFGEQPRALLMLPTAGLAPEPDPQILSAGFDLTPAEGRLLAALAQCLDVQGAAEALDISFHTARCHLRNIFDKTGVRTQKELLHQVQQLVALG